MIPVQELFASMKKSFGTFFSTEAHWDAEIIRYINEWTRLLCKKYPWYFNERETIVEVINTDAVYAIPETIEIQYIENSNWAELTTIATRLSEYRKLAKTQPIVIWIWDTYFRASQIGIYTLLHSVYPEKVVSIYDAIPFPDSMQNILLEYSLAIGFLSIKDEANAKTHLDFAESLLQNEISRKSNRAPNKIKRVSSYNF